MKDELWLIWKESKAQRRYKVGSLCLSNNKYTFKYINPELDEARENGFLFYFGFEDYNKVYESDTLFYNIEARLPNKKNPSYLDVLNRYHLSINSSDYEILKATRGKLHTDNFEFVPAFNEGELYFDVAGKLYSDDFDKAIKIINRYDRIILECEPNNKYDDHAIKVFLEKDLKKYHLGYVPRYYSHELYSLLENGIAYSALIDNYYYDERFPKEEYEVYINLVMKKN